jgi:hypothetical protein
MFWHNKYKANYRDSTGTQENVQITSNEPKHVGKEKIQKNHTSK